MSFSASKPPFLHTFRAASLILILAGVGLAQAQLPKVGGETLLNATSIQLEDNPSVALDAVGNYVTAYSYYDGSGQGIAVRRVQRNGTLNSTLIYPERAAAGPQAGDQQDPAVAMANDGRFVVVWEDNQARGGLNYDVKFSLYAANGSRIAGPTTVSTVAAGVRENARVAMNRNTGEFVVVFAGGVNQFDVNVYMRRYSATGAPLDMSDVKVNSSTNLQTANPSVALAENGNFVVAWEGDSNSDSNWEATFQRYKFNAGGTATAQGTNTIASLSGSDTTNVNVACGATGDFALVWIDGLPASQTDPKNILLRRYNSDGTAKAGQQVVKTGAYSGHGISDIPRARISMANDNSLFVTYIHDDEVYGRFYDANGAALGSEIHVNTTTSPDFGEFQAKAEVALNPAGNRGAVVWSGTGAADSNGAYMQRFAAANVAPVLAAIPDQIVQEPDAFTYTAVATEGSSNFGDVISYSLTTSTSATINPSTGKITWTPAPSDIPGVFTFTVTATDNGEPPLSSSVSFTVTTKKDNTAVEDWAMY